MQVGDSVDQAWYLAVEGKIALIAPNVNREPSSGLVVFQDDMDVSS
jgi:hypothetical protein